MVAGRSMSDLPDRLLCIDKTCTGTINERGYCNVCGKSLDGKYDPLRADPEISVKSHSKLTQFQLECEHLLTERLAQVGSRISNRTVCITTSITAETITGTIEGTDIEFWINDGFAQFRSSHGSGEFWVYAGMSLAGLPEEFVDAVLEMLQKVKAKHHEKGAG